MDLNHKMQVEAPGAGSSVLAINNQRLFMAVIYGKT